MQTLTKNAKHIFTQLSTKYNMPIQVIEEICLSPFKVIRDNISQLSTKDMLMAYLGRIKMKKRYAKKER